MGRSSRSRYTSVADIQQVLKGTRKKYKANMPEAINKLAALGYEAITLAWSQRTITDRTYNLYDSYASAIYLKGQLLPHTIRYVQGEMSNEPDRFGKTGRDYVREYLENPDVDVKSKDITIVCVAAVPYARYLEQGTYNVAPRQFFPLGEEFRTTGKATEGNHRPLGKPFQIIRIAGNFLNAPWTREEINKICKGLFDGTVIEGHKFPPIKDFRSMEA